MEITLKGNNVYRTGTILLFENGEGMLVRDLLELAAGEEDSYHTVKKSDRLDLLAYNYYKNTVADASKFWWVIADANSIENPLDISLLVGKDILIPSILNVLLTIQD